MSRKLTTSQLFGLTPEERTALINTVAGEAYQQGGGKDIAAVTANLLSRRISNYGGMNNMVDLVMAPGQYAANFTTSRDQIMNPGLIGAYDRDRIGKIVDNPSMVLAEYMAGGGPVSFRGTKLYKNRRGDEYTPIEGKSNFYFDPLKTSNPNAYQKGLDMFRGVEPSASASIRPLPRPQHEHLLQSLFLTELLLVLVLMVWTLVRQKQRKQIIHKTLLPTILPNKCLVKYKAVEPTLLSMN